MERIGTIHSRAGRLFRGLFASLALLLALFPAACSDPEPILVGFSGQLTGTHSDLGVQGRNGAQFAVEEINAAGGVAGRPLQLLAMDDGNRPEQAVSADLDLLRRGVTVIIGHMTSSQTLAALPEVQRHGGILLSPTTATPTLDGIEDSFFRVIPSNAAWARGLAAYAHGEGLRRVAVLGDGDNVGYTDTFNRTFMESLRQDGGEVVYQRVFSSKEGVPWDDILEGVRQTRPQALVVTAAARDVAALAQRLRRDDDETRILCPAWPATRELLQAGGRSVEGIVFATSYSEDNASPVFLKFQKDYQARFGWRPNFAAAFAYEAVTVLASALERTGGKAEGLREALVYKYDFPGIIGPFRLDAMGDVQRPTIIITVRDGRYVTLGTADVQ